MSTEADNLQRLGEYVVQARTDAGLRTTTALARETGLSARLLGDIENGRRRVGRSSYQLVERALGWEPGSADLVIRTGEQPPVLVELKGGQQRDVMLGSPEDADTVGRVVDQLRTYSRLPAAERSDQMMEDIEQVDELLLQASRQIDRAMLAIARIRSLHWQAQTDAGRDPSG